MNANLRIGGVNRFSTCDYPDNITTTIFTQGCMFNCTYCHNADLISPKSSTLIDFNDVLNFIKQRKNMLDGVVFSGGEPLLQSALLDAIKTIKQLNLKIGLHTSGIPHTRFIEVLPYIDWVGFDVKTNFNDYQSITSVDKGDEVKRSLESLIKTDIDYEIRTTVHPFYHSNNSLNLLGKHLINMGVRNWTIQMFRKEGVKDTELHVPPMNVDLDSSITKQFERFLIR